MPAESAPADLAASFARHREEFLTHFGPGSGLRTFFAPGRVNLFGAHLDYSGGPVMPTAINRGTFLALRPRADDRVLLRSQRDGQVFDAAIEELPAMAQGAWFDYPVGVLRAAREAGYALGGFELYAGGDLPLGAGLSSSASICVGTAMALDQVFGWSVNAVDWIDLALSAERGFVGVQCGIMDPYAIGLARPGHLLWLDCKDRSYEHVPLDFETVSIAVVDTGVRRELAQSEFNKRVEQCAAAFEALRVHHPEATCLRDIPVEVFEQHAGALPRELYGRAHHVVHEVQRAYQAREALARGDARTMGELMVETQASLREHYEVSCPELDAIIACAEETPGAYGGRLTGAGFGGCAVLLLRHGAEEEVRDAVARSFEGRFGRRPPIAFYRGDEGPREIV